MRILVIQDNVEYVPFLKERLVKDAGIEAAQVEGAATLKEGLARLSEGNIDLVLLELSLPDSRGLMTYEQLQSNAPLIPVIILTGLEEELRALKALSQGAQDYILKNETDGRFLGRVMRNAVERQQAKARLINLSIKDDLTGLFNRRGFHFLTEQQIKVSERTKKNFALILADLDGLKKINDTFGHLQGDYAIAHTSNILRQTFRRSDILARLGGDEFAVTAIEADEGTEALMLERLQKNIERHNQMKISPYALSLSAGCVFFDSANPESLEVLIQKADSSLYEMKKGRKPFV